ncbi:uncharacterized protein [Bemisia tabaci]
MRFLCVLLVALSGSEALLQQLYNSLNLRSELASAADPSPRASRLARKTAVAKSATPVTFSEVPVENPATAAGKITGTVVDVPEDIASDTKTVAKSSGTPGELPKDASGVTGTVVESSGVTGAQGAVGDVPKVVAGSGGTVTQSSGTPGELAKDASGIAGTVVESSGVTGAQGAVGDVPKVVAGSVGTVTQSSVVPGTQGTTSDMPKVAVGESGTVAQSSLVPGIQGTTSDMPKVAVGESGTVAQSSLVSGIQGTTSDVPKVTVGEKGAAMQSSVVAATQGAIGNASKVAAEDTGAVLGSSGVANTQGSVKDAPVVAAGDSGTRVQSAGPTETPGTIFAVPSDAIGSKGAVAQSSGTVGTPGTSSDVPERLQVELKNNGTVGQGAGVVGKVGTGDVSKVVSGSTGTEVQSSGDVETPGTVFAVPSDAVSNGGVVSQSSGSVGTATTASDASQQKDNLKKGAVVASSLGDAETPTVNKGVSKDPLSDGKTQNLGDANANVGSSLSSPTGSTPGKNSDKIGAQFDTNQNVGAQPDEKVGGNIQKVDAPLGQIDSVSAAEKPRLLENAASEGGEEKSMVQGKGPLNEEVASEVPKNTKKGSSVVMKITPKPPIVGEVTKKPSLKEKVELRKSQKDGSSKVQGVQNQPEGRQIPLENFDDDEFFDRQDVTPKVIGPLEKDTLPAKLPGEKVAAKISPTENPNLPGEKVAAKISPTENPNLPTVRFPHSPPAAENPKEQITSQMIAETLPSSTTLPPVLENPLISSKETTPKNNEAQPVNNGVREAQKPPRKNTPTAEGVQKHGSPLVDKEADLIEAKTTPKNNEVQPVNNEVREAQKPPRKNTPTAEGVEKHGSPLVDKEADLIGGALLGSAPDATREEGAAPGGADEAIVNSALDRGQKPGAEIGVNGDILGTIPSLVPAEKPRFPDAPFPGGVGSLKCRLVPTLGLRLLTPVTKADLCAHLLRYECESPLAQYCARRVSLRTPHQHYHMLEHKLWAPGKVYQQPIIPPKFNDYDHQALPGYGPGIIPGFAANIPEKPYSHQTLPSYQPVITPKFTDYDHQALPGYGPGIVPGFAANIPEKSYSHQISNFEIQNQHPGLYPTPGVYGTDIGQNYQESLPHGYYYDGVNYVSDQAPYSPLGSNHQDGLETIAPPGEHETSANSPIVSPFVNVQSSDITPDYPNTKSQFGPNSPLSNQNVKLQDSQGQLFPDSAAVQRKSTLGPAPALSPFSSQLQRKRRAKDSLSSSLKLPQKLSTLNNAKFKQKIAPSSSLQSLGAASYSGQDSRIAGPNQEIISTPKNPIGVVGQGQSLPVDPPKNLNPISDDPNDPDFLRVDGKLPKKRALDDAKKRKLLRLFKTKGHRIHRIKKQQPLIKFDDDWESTLPLIYDSASDLAPDEDRRTRGLKPFHQVKSLPKSWERTYPLNFPTDLHRRISPYSRMNNLDPASSRYLGQRRFSLNVQPSPYLPVQSSLPERNPYLSHNYCPLYGTEMTGLGADPDYVKMKVAAIVDHIITSILQNKPTVAFNVDSTKAPCSSLHSQETGFHDLKADKYSTSLAKSR